MSDRVYASFAVLKAGLRVVTTLGIRALPCPEHQTRAGHRCSGRPSGSCQPRMWLAQAVLNVTYPSPVDRLDPEVRARFDAMYAEAAALGTGVLDERVRAILVSEAQAAREKRPPRRPDPAVAARQRVLDERELQRERRERWQATEDV